MNILLTVLVGVIFGSAFYKLKVPGGMMIGALLGTLLLSTTLHCAEIPYTAKFTAQVITGAFIGCSIKREDIKCIKDTWKPAVIVISMFLGINLLLGFGLSHFTDMSLITALLSTIAGGLSEVTLMASDMGADVSTVVLLQFIRMCCGIGVFPTWIAWLDRNNSNHIAETNTNDHLAKKQEKTHSIRLYIMVISIAAISGYIGKKIGVPSGGLLFAIIGSMLFNTFIKPVKLPRLIRRFAQLLSGVYVGCSIPYQSIYVIHRLIIPAIVIVFIFILNSYVTGHFLNRKFNIPIREAMLMATPAGASDMMLISADIGVQSTVLVVVHILRMLTASTIVPQIDYFIVGLF